MDRDEVAVALKILMEEVETVANGLNEDGAKAFQSGEYDRARQLIEDATRLASFRQRVRDLQREWQTAFRAVRTKRKQKRGKRKSRGRLERGLRTSEEAFRLPILESLAEFSGSGAIADVLERVEARMRQTLNKHDRQPTPSGANILRWRNAAQWCRQTLVDEGLLRSGSPRGVWEISAAGRRALETSGRG